MFEIGGLIHRNPAVLPRVSPGKEPQQTITPYASLQPNGDSFEEYKASLVVCALCPQILGALPYVLPVVSPSIRWVARLS